MSAIKPTTLMLTGQVRLPQFLIKTARAYRKLREEGILSDAVIATWHGEIDQHEGLHGLLLDSGFRLIERDPPEEAGLGNIWMQMAAYAAGLEQITTPYVLKSRPDIILGDKLIRRLVTTVPSHEPDLKPVAPFAEKMWVPWLEISRPCFYADDCFFVALKDAWHLHNTDKSYDVYNHMHGIAHMRRFLYPFRHHDEAQMYLANYLCGYMEKEQYYPHLWQWLHDPRFVRILTWYYALTRRCFNVLTEPGDVLFRDFSVPMQRPLQLPLTTQFSELMGGTGKHGMVLFCYDDAFIKAVERGVYDNESLGWTLSHGMKNSLFPEDR